MVGSIADAKAPKIPLQTYRGSGFSVQYPRTWSIWNMGSNIDQVEFYSPESDQSVLIHVTPLPQYTYAKAKTDYLKKEANEFLINNARKILEQKVIRLNRRQAQYISVLLDTTKRTDVRLLARESNRADLDPIILGIDYSAKEDAYDKEIEDIFLKSFRATLTKELLERERMRKEKTHIREEAAGFLEPTYLPKGMNFGWRDQKSTDIDGLYGVLDWYQCPNIEDAYLTIDQKLADRVLRGVIEMKSTPKSSKPIDVNGYAGFIDQSWYYGSSPSIRWTTDEHEIRIDGCNFSEEILLQIAESMRHPE
jgi:hypothetical protein